MQFSFSTSPSTVKRASEMISLSEGLEGHEQDTLLGCAMLLLAIALEQALTTHLRTLSAFYRATGDSALALEAEDLQVAYFKTRLFRTPEISHIYSARLDESSDYVDYLTELIDRRNSLMHFAERPVSFQFDVDNDEAPKGVRLSFDPSSETGTSAMDSGILTVNVNPKDASTGLASNPWGDVTPAEARRSLAAVEMYTDRVLNDPGECDILLPI